MLFLQEINFFFSESLNKKFNVFGWDKMPSAGTGLLYFFRFYIYKNKKKNKKKIKKNLFDSQSTLFDYEQYLFCLQCENYLEQQQTKKFIKNEIYYKSLKDE